MDGLPLIEGGLKLSLLEIVREHAPHESVGIIYDDIVYELRNDHDFPDSNFSVNKQELRRLTEDLGIAVEDILEQVFLWHSHPNGGVGPSRFDMTNKTPLKHHLVVALVEDDIVPTWY